MGLMNFVDRAAPAVSAAWLNTVDALKYTVFGDATNKADAQAALTDGSPWAIDHGGTGATTNAGAATAIVPYATAEQVGGVLFARTAAEVSAGVVPSKYAYPEFDFRRYGGDTEASNNAGALTSAVAVASIKGGIIYFPPGTFRFATFPSLDSKQGIIFQGTAPANSGLARGTVLLYTGTASTVISASGAQGIEFRDLQIIHNNALFTGTYLKFGGDAAFCAVRNCFFGANVGTGCTHLNLDAMTTFTAERCVFMKGNPSVKGQDSAGTSYSNSITFRDCEWYYQVSSPVVWGGESWVFEECVFEALISGLAGAFDYGSPKSLGIAFRSCWFGDVTTSGGTWISAYAEGLTVSNCRFGGEATNSAAIALKSCKGAMISGNNFDTFSVGINFTDASCAAVSIVSNIFSTVTNPIGSSANMPADTVFTPNYPDISVDQTFTGTLTGMTGTTTGTIHFRREGNLVHLYVKTSAVTGTSNATSMTMTGLPTALQPVDTPHVGTFNLIDNSVNVTGIASISGGTITFSGDIANYAGTGFKNSGTKGLDVGWTMAYPLS